MKNEKKYSFLLILLASISMHLVAQPPALSGYRWTPIEAKGEVTGRHEDSFVAYKGKFYLLGGRGINPVNVFDPKTNSWEARSKSPMEIHHFQAVVYKDAIYLVGAMTGKYPVEPPLENIWIYYPEKDKWEKGPEIPIDKRRGGAGTVIYNDMIYIVAGIELGHTSGTTNIFDSYNLKTGEWKSLSKAPHVRDHFPAIVVDDRLYCVGGRNSSVHQSDNFGAFFNATESSVDYYDFKEQKWFTLKEILPFPTAAGSLVHINNCLLYIGGEGSQAQAFNQTQCLDLTTGKWSQLSPLSTGRHGSGAILHNNNIYTAAGSPIRGGGNMTSIEYFSASHTWKPLFNGTNLDGWSVKCTAKDKDQQFWTAENGMIQCNSLGKKEHGYVWLQSEGEYGDFELRLKFQSCLENKGNSGVQVRSRWDGEAKIADMGTVTGWLDGPQVDINPSDPFRNGLIYDETRDVRHWIDPVLPGSKIDKEKYAPKKIVHYFEDQESGWNDMTIICRGTKITTIVNNIVVSDYDGTGILNDEAHRKYQVGMKGHIALQLHMKDEIKIRFKDIELRELTTNN